MATEITCEQCKYITGLYCGLTNEPVRYFRTPCDGYINIVCGLFEPADEEIKKEIEEAKNDIKRKLGE